MSTRSDAELPAPGTSVSLPATSLQASPARGLRGTFDAIFEYPAFRRLWCAVFAASLGQWMQSTALGWLAFDLTDSGSFVGLVAFMAGAPFLVVSIPGGALIDRFDRRRLLIIIQALAVVLAIAVSIVVIGGWVEPWHLLVAAFANGSLQAILSPSQQSLVPRLVPRSSLTNAVGLISAGGNMTRVFGPSLAGAVIGFVGTGEAFLLQAVAMVIACSLILTTRFPVGGTQIVGGGLGSVLDGIRFVVRRDDLRGLFLLAAIPSFCVFPYISFMSVFAKDVLQTGPQGLGLLMASSGSGAVIGGLTVASNRREHGFGRLLVGAGVLYGLVIIGFAATSLIWVGVPFLIVAGALGSYYMSGNNALIQHRITDDVRGRVMGTYMLTFGLMPLGALPLGLIADRTGIQVATITGAILTVLLTLLLALKNRAIIEL